MDCPDGPEVDLQAAVGVEDERLEGLEGAVGDHLVLRRRPLADGFTLEKIKAIIIILLAQ